MLLRCQRCQAVFSLQDGVVASGAAFKVECGRCLQVFDASPLARPDPEAKPPAQAHPATPAPAPPAAGALERKAQADELARVLRPRRPEDEKSDIERELARVIDRRKTRLRWIAGAILLAAFGLLALGLRARFSGLPREAQARMEKARGLLLRDDSASLQQATALFTEAARLSAGEAMPEGERGFSMLLQAAAQGDLATRLQAAQKEKAGVEQQALAQESEEFQRDSTRLLQHGVAAAKAALEDDAQDVAALRALALSAALTGVSDQGALAQAERLAPQDAWVLFVKAMAARKTPDAALAALALARQAEPRLLRAQVEMAALSMDRQEPGPARDALARVLQENPEHERARRMLSLLPAAPQ